MIQITPQMRVLVAIEPVDGRKGIDSLARLCQEQLAEDPFSGCVFIFRSRRSTTVRVLTYDGQGFWLLIKRLSKVSSSGGRKAKAVRRGGWKHGRRSCCWLPAMHRECEQRRCGGRWAVRHPRRYGPEKVLAF